MPVLLAFGERDVCADARGEPAAYAASPRVELAVVDRVAHMHNFGPGRQRLWNRLVALYGDVEEPVVEAEQPAEDGTVSPAALEALLRAAWNDPGLRVGALELFGDGHSGFTYAAELDGREVRGRFVVRLSPPGARIAGSADVGRQGRIMAALHAAGLPTPRVLLADSTGALGGRAVLVMELLSGMGWREAATGHGDRWVADAAVDVLHRLVGYGPTRPGWPTRRSGRSPTTSSSGAGCSNAPRRICTATASGSERRCAPPFR